MKVTRLIPTNSISGQMALLIVISLIAIHLVVTAGFFLSQRFESARLPDDGPGEVMSLIKLIAAAAPAERERLLDDIARAFPHVQIRPADAMARADTAASADPRLGHLQHRLGAGFYVAALQPPVKGEPLSIAVRVPDGNVFTARLSPPLHPPRFVGPLVLTLLFVVVSVTLLGVWAARVLNAPLSRFAAAAEGFRLDDETAALPERGPQEIRTVAKAFNQMRERIRALVDGRTRMLAAMGHDLRTPITRLRLRSEFIADEALRAQMLRDLDQMRAMTEGVLSFLRDGQTGEPATAIDIASTLQTICDQFADLGHEVHYAGPDHATALARPDDLHRAVANLVDNAVRHAAGATVVRLAAAPQALTIEVEDDGPGIPDASKAAMLEAFVRGEEARTMDDRAGFGLGLSIARAIAEAHGGSLTLHDATPHGLIARITLPAAQPGVAEAAE